MDELRIGRYGHVLAPTCACGARMEFDALACEMCADVELPSLPVAGVGLDNRGRMMPGIPEYSHWRDYGYWADYGNERLFWSWRDDDGWSRNYG